jgi:tetratricopeptide (TPR) repeat protein
VIHSDSLLDALHGLVRRSLLVRDRERFRLLDSIAAFAAEHLPQDAAMAARFRHGRWFGACARATVPGGRRVDEVAADAANYEAVVRRAATDPQLVADALCCGHALAFTWDLRGPFELRVAFADQVMTLPESEHTQGQRSRIEVQRYRARWRRRQGDVAGARADLDEARRRAERIGAQDLLARIITNEGDLEMQLGRNVEGWARYEEALAVAEAAGLDDVASAALGGMATLAGDVGQGDRQEALIDEAIRRAQKSADPLVELVVRKVVATTFLERDDMVAAGENIDRAIVLARQVGDIRGIATVTGQRGLIFEATGDLDAAERCYRSVITAMREEHDPSFTAYYEGFLGRVAVRRGDWEQGRAGLERARSSMGEWSDPTFGVLFGYSIALVDARAGKVQQAQAWAEAQQGRPIVLDPRVPVALARGYAAEAIGDRVAASAAVQEARRHLDADSGFDACTRQLALTAVADLDLSVHTWRIAADGSYVLPAGLGRIEIGRLVANSRVLAALVEGYLATPGQPCDVPALAAAGWPGERIVASAAANRVRVALSALRKLGLGDLIARGEGGWFLDPGVPIAINTVTMSG